VRVPPDVDEEGNIIDGKHRKQICDELGIEYPVRVLAGLTEAQKLEHAYQVNVARRQLRKAQKRQLAKKLWHDGQT
jgi:ParB-like chromosome segregation protein Spo0J